MRIAAIIARCKEIDALQEDIERRMELENEGQFNEEARAEYQTLKSEYDTLIAEKKQIESDAEMRACRAGRAEELQPRNVTRRTAPNSGAPVVDQPATPIDRAGAEANGGPPLQTPRFSIPARARRGGTPKNFFGVVENRDPSERAYRFGMWALARIQQCIPGYSFPEASRFVHNYMGGMGITNLSHGENDGATGGQFLVPEEFSSDLIILRERYGVARRLLGRETMMSDVKHIPKRASGLTASFTGENQKIVESNMTWQDVQLIAKDLTCMARMSNQLSSDAAIQMGDTLAGEISYAFSNKEDDCAFNGNGGSAYGGIQGILNLLVNIDGAGGNSAGAVVAGSTGSWANLVLADFNKVVGQLPQFADTPNACWVTHRTFYGQIMQKLEMAGSGNTLETISQGDRRPRPLFCGYPVEFSQVFPSATAATGVPAILGDLSLGCVFGDRQQTSIAFSEHATINGENVFERNQIAVRGTERFDIQNHGCGTTTAVGPIVGLRLA